MFRRKYWPLLLAVGLVVASFAPSAALAGDFPRQPGHDRDFGNQFGRGPHSSKDFGRRKLVPVVVFVPSHAHRFPPPWYGHPGNSGWTRPRLDHGPTPWWYRW